MIKTLVSIEADLASSLAVRFSCRLASLMELEIHPVYVKESPPHESAMGAGWASRTWERELIRRGKEEIAELIAAEVDSCPVLKEPRVIYGDRDAELLKITTGADFGLYVEGTSFPRTPAEILKRLRSQLYQGMEPPIILVRALRKIDHILALCLDVEGTRALGLLLRRLLGASSLPVVLTFTEEDAAVNGGLKEEAAGVQARLSEQGVAVSVQPGQAVHLGPEAVKALNQHGLAAIAVKRNVKKDGPELRWLSLLHTSMLLAFH